MIISVVGNAKSLLEKKNGPIIDNADMVIRFNGGYISNPQAQGKKHMFMYIHSPKFIANMHIFSIKMLSSGIHVNSLKKKTSYKKP